MVVAERATRLSRRDEVRYAGIFSSGSICGDLLLQLSAMPACESLQRVPASGPPQHSSSERAEAHQPERAGYEPMGRRAGDKLRRQGE